VLNSCAVRIIGRVEKFSSGRGGRATPNKAARTSHQTTTGPRTAWNLRMTYSCLPAAAPEETRFLGRLREATSVCANDEGQWFMVSQNICALGLALVLPAHRFH